MCLWRYGEGVDETELRFDVWRVGPDVTVKVTHVPSGRSAQVYADGCGEYRLKQIALAALEALLAMDAKLAAG